MSGNQNQLNQNGTSSSNSEGEKKIFIGGLTNDITEQQVKTYFARFGEIASIDLKMDASTGLSRGYGFVTFAETGPVNTLLSSSMDHFIGNKKIDVKKVAKKNRLECKIFVGGITQDMTEEDIKTFFSQFGTITEFEQPYDKARNMKKNFCFISFENVADVKYALTLPKQTINGKAVDVKSVIFNPETMTKTGRRNKLGGGGMYGGYDSQSGLGYMPSMSYEAYGPAYGGYDYNALGYDPNQLGYGGAPPTQDYQGYQRGRFKESRYRYAPY